MDESIHATGLRADLFVYIILTTQFGNQVHKSEE